MTSLSSKLLKITAKAETVGKSGYNSHQNYSYSTEGDLHKTIKPLLADQGILLQWSVEDVQMLSDNTLALVRVKYTLTDTETGESIECTSVGTGHDKQDKGIYKAMTGAHKYFIQKTFLLSSDDDPEKDSTTSNTKKSTTKLKSTSSFTKSQTKSTSQTSPNVSFGFSGKNTSKSTEFGSKPTTSDSKPGFATKKSEPETTEDHDVEF